MKKIFLTSFNRIGGAILQSKGIGGGNNFMSQPEFGLSKALYAFKDAYDLKVQNPETESIDSKLT